MSDMDDLDDFNFMDELQRKCCDDIDELLPFEPDRELEEDTEIEERVEADTETPERSIADAIDDLEGRFGDLEMDLSPDIDDEGMLDE